jgi:plastocyanin domain-containing protein
MAVGASEYLPAALTVEAGKPVSWVVDGTKASGCTQYLVARDFGISQRLQKGENVISFMPTQKGTFTFMCGMGMVRGTMTVV